MYRDCSCGATVEGDAPGWIPLAKQWKGCCSWFKSVLDAHKGSLSQLLVFDCRFLLVQARDFTNDTTIGLFAMCSMCWMLRQVLK